MTDRQARSGHKYYVEFDGVDLSAFVRDFDPGTGGVYVDSTAGNQALETTHRIRGSVNPTATILVDDSASGLAVRAVLEESNTGNLIWGENGNTSGQRKGGISAICTKSNIVGSHEAEQVIDVEWGNVGLDWLYDPNSATF